MDFMGKIIIGIIAIIGIIGIVIKINSRTEKMAKDVADGVEGKINTVVQGITIQ